MIPKGLFSQLALILLSVLVIFTYVKPALLETKSVQDKISLYQEQRMKVSSVNEKLTKLKADVDGVDESDKHRLLTYMPNTVDTVAVPRDVSIIAQKSGLSLTAVKYEGAQKALPGEEVDPAQSDGPEVHTFSFTVTGSYAQIKQMLTSFEENEYPLEVRELLITAGEGGFLNAEMKIYTYNRALPVVQEVTI